MIFSGVEWIFIAALVLMTYVAIVGWKIAANLQARVRDLEETLDQHGIYL